MVGSVLGADLGTTTTSPNGVRFGATTVEAAEWIDRDSRSPYPRVAASEIGMIGYYSRADMVDYMGNLDARAIDSIRRGDFSPVAV
jgi:hypothetical protein